MSDTRRAALVEKVETMLARSDLSAWDYVNLALEEAALVMEQRTSRQRFIYAKQNDQPVAPCKDAAAIRAIKAAIHDRALKGKP